jgi:hypothetical protein
MFRRQEQSLQFVQAEMFKMEVPKTTNNDDKSAGTLGCWYNVADETIIQPERSSIIFMNIQHATK